LCRHNAALSLGPRLQWSSLPCSVLLSAPELVPTLALQALHGIRHTRYEMKLMFHVTAMYHMLRWHAPPGAAVVMLDHGPVFWLAKLDEFGSRATRTPGFRRWWQRMATRWAAELHAVIYVDACDATLLQRIRSRERSHRAKSWSAAEAINYLARYRAGYERIFPVLETRADLAVLRLDTEHESPSVLASRIMAVLSLPSPEGVARIQSSPNQLAPLAAGEGYGGP
jgi:hypothetical protein